MSTTTKFKEYIWLVNTIHRAGRITLAEINRRWVQTEMSGGVDMARTTFYRHKYAIEDIIGIYIECDKRHGNKYYIGNERVLGEDSVQNWMLSTLTVSNVVSESLSLHQRILLENVPSGGELLQMVIDAMKGSRMVSIVYRRYGAETDSTFTLAPYCIKLFRRRWYMLGRFADADKMGIFAFDRMVQVTMEDERFVMDEDFDAAWYFSDSYGIVVDQRVPVQRVVLRAYGAERYYLRDLPLHHSQREIGGGKDYIDFELNLRPTADFKAQLLSRGQWLEVRQPQSLAQEIVEWHMSAVNRYKQ
ncbi:MAG: WYL domain-containing protein [Prevotella sp.]|nr:WYL domain-containing protein [Prevotella sp.]